jgi:uncharacterized protein (TIGR00645 family)
MLQASEKLLANVLIASRWLMAPLYVGLIAALIVVVVGFFRELVHIIVGFADLRRNGLILGALELIDLVLVGNLVLIVIGVGLDTVVSRQVADLHVAARPKWMSEVDFAGLKLKIIASIVAIAAVDLLESFVEIDTVDKGTLLWQIAVFMAFVIAGLLLAWMDRLGGEKY